jgi:hypothetical protein
LLLALDSNGEVLARLPVDLVTLGVVVDEVTTVTVLLLVVVCLGDGLVGEELVLGELEDETESGAVQVLHADVGQELEGALVTVGDGLGERRVLHSGKPELGDTLDVGGRLVILSLVGLIILVVVLLFVLLASLDLLLGRLGGTVDDLGTLLVERGVLGEELLLEGEDFLLELGLELGVLLLDALETSDTSADGGRERLDVTR